ncbi:hypothetical protein [Chitinophaga sp. RAB17]|uniref:hypothetical protein n=1 Tax=Chitinophaga sp. RAB17 TaxID=3233049 RepID=UPI003F8ECB71
MKKILFLFLLAGLFYACKKDNIGSKPILTFKGYSVDSITADLQEMNVIMGVEDGDGDIEDTLQIASIFDSRGPNQDTLYSIKGMPGIGANKGSRVKGDIYINLKSDEYKLVQIDNDSIHFLVFIRDNAGHYSDTIATPKMPYHNK